MPEQRTQNHLKDPVCLGLYWNEFSGEEIHQDKRKFIFSETVKVPEMLDLIDIKFFLKDEIRRVVFTRWSINSVVFIDPSPAAAACLVKYIYTDFGQIKHQTAFYICDSKNKKVWLVR